MLWSGRQARSPQDDPGLRRTARVALAVLAVGFAGSAVWFWVTTDGPVPFTMAPLGARFLAAWIAFFTVLAVLSALRPSRSEARVPLLALLYGVGGLLVAAVHPGALGARTVGYLAALVAIVAIAGLALLRGFGSNERHDDVGWIRRMGDTRPVIGVHASRMRPRSSLTTPKGSEGGNGDLVQVSIRG